MKDLLLLTADQDAEFTARPLLEKIPRVEHIPTFEFDIIRHPHRDPGVATQAVEYVRPYISDYRFLMIIFDYEGSGKEASPAAVEQEMENALNRNGWQDRSACILFNPELESWLWVNRTHLHDILEWKHRESIDEWLQAKGFLFNENKPIRPKEAFETALKRQNIPRSSALYSKLAQKASYRLCTDPSFEKFITTIKIWFSQ